MLFPKPPQCAATSTICTELGSTFPPVSRQATGPCPQHQACPSTPSPNILHHSGAHSLPKNITVPSLFSHFFSPLILCHPLTMFPWHFLFFDNVFVYISIFTSAPTHWGLSETEWLCPVHLLSPTLAMDAAPSLFVELDSTGFSVAKR